MNNSFELEGIEIRIQQKPLAEFVAQSANIVIDYTANPKIYFEDGNLYFYDQLLEEPIALSKVVNYYDRIRYVDGELRFYDKELSTYINLSFFTSTRTSFVDKPNSLIGNQVKRISRSDTYDSKEQFLNALYLETSVIEMSGEPFLTTITGASGAYDVDMGVETILYDFQNALFNSTMLQTGENVFDFLVNNFTYGLNNYSDDGFGPNSSIFNLDTGEFINKITAFNDRYFALNTHPNQSESTTVLGNQYFSSLVTEIAEIFQSFDGMGNILHKIFGKKTSSESNNGFDIVTDYSSNSSGYNPQAQTSTFVIDAIENGGSCIKEAASRVSLGTFYKGNMMFRYSSGQITSNITTGLYNTPIGSNYCLNRSSVSVVETTLGDLSYDNITVLPVFNEDEVTAWFRTPSSTTDGDGNVTFEYVFTPVANKITNSFQLDATISDIPSFATLGGEEYYRLWKQNYGLKTKLLGIFEPGKITFTVASGYVRPDQEFETVYNDIQTTTFTASISSTEFQYGFVNSTLGSLDFTKSVTFEFEEKTAVEVWYEDFDSTDNEGVLTINYVYEAKNQTVSLDDGFDENEVVYYDGFIRDPRYKHLSDYSLDHLARIVSFGFSSLWYDALFEEFKSRGYVKYTVEQDDEWITPTTQLVFENILEITADDATILIQSLIEAVDTRFKSQTVISVSAEGDNISTALDDDDEYTETTYRSIIDRFLTRNFWGEKVFYEVPELTDIEVDKKIGIIDFRNYFLYSGGSGISNENLIYRGLNQMNDVWLDVPNTYAVVPKVPNGYALSTMVNFNADYRPGIPCELEFRLWDSTAQVELDRMVFKFPRMSHTDQIGDILFENKETLHVQLAYFGPVPSLKCEELKFKQFCQSNDRNINQHVVVDESVIFTDDSTDLDVFEIIADRVSDFLKGRGVSVGSKTVDLESPRVLRVQWRMRFTDEVSSKPQLIHDLPQFTFDRNHPENENLFTINVFSFGDVYGRGLTVRGIVNFNGRQKRIIVNEDSIAIMPDEKYSVSLTPSKNINVWVENKSSGSFDIVAEKEFVGEVSWVAMRQRADINLSRTQDDPRTIPFCVVDRQYRYSEYTDLQILALEGYYNANEDITLPTESTTDDQTGLISTPPSSFIDPNGTRCSQECFDDCPEDYICSPDCYTASLTESGCGCCQCIADNDCPPGYICDEVNECVEA